MSRGRQAPIADADAGIPGTLEAFFAMKAATDRIREIVDARCRDSCS